MTAFQIDPSDALQAAGLPPEPPGHMPTQGRPFPLRLLRRYRKRRAMDGEGYDKVFVIGSSRTGTSSLAVALMELGFTYTGWNPKLVEALRRGDVDDVRGVVDRFEAFKDPPWNVGAFYEFLDRAYPRSKFINTVREPDGWVLSFEHFFGSHDRERLLASYSARNDRIRRYFAGRERDLLELNVCGGEGWERLTPFLGFPFRHGPLLNVDRSGERASRWRT